MASKAKNSARANPAPVRPRRVSIFASALFLVMSTFTLGAAAISLLGSPSDGTHSVTLRLGPGTLAHADDAHTDTEGSETGHPDDPIAAFAAHPEDPNGRIRIAILVTGLGLSEKETRRALATLPRGTTLSFSPYARNAQPLVDEARRLGFEVLLEVPLEPFDYPDNDPGPHTLLTGLSASENEARLDWLTGRFTGFPGLVAVSGGRFLAVPDATRPFFELVKARGYYFVDAASTQPALVLRNASDIGVPAIARSVVLDDALDRGAVDAALLRLVSHAEAEGTALGITAWYPAMGDHIARWAGGLEAEGFVLLPLSALVRPAIN